MASIAKNVETDFFPALDVTFKLEKKANEKVKICAE